MTTLYKSNHHSYNGPTNSRSQRQRSKITAGIKFNFKLLRWAFRQLEYEKARSLELQNPRTD